MTVTSDGPDGHDDDESSPTVTADCSSVEDSDWDSSWITLEAEVLSRINAERARGADCGSYGRYGPADPLSLDTSIRCAARLHARDMAVTGYFDHFSPDGSSAGDRMKAAGYSYTIAGENLAAGQPTPAIAVSEWLESDGHCSVLMNPAFLETGIGVYLDAGSLYGVYWVQDFGAPAP